jgi:NAD(P)-dependent dehydrogenase (short-subunit alcohol dehydrogenase family)
MTGAPPPDRAASPLGRLPSPRALVTGGTEGIGRAVAEALAAAGWAVVLAARTRERVEAAVAALPGAGHAGLVLDVADAAAWPAAMAAVDAGGPLDGVVTAAGVLGPIGPADAVDPAGFARTLAVNLGGTFLALHHALPRLAASGGAAVTFSGGGGPSPLPRYDAYAASKAAVVRLTENVAADAAERGVRVNAVAPGFVATRMHDGTLAAGPDAAGAAYLERTRSKLERGGDDPAEAAALTAFLLSGEAAGITGRLLSAKWDPWRDPAFRARLAAQPALATLRRIDDQLFTSVRQP